MRKNIIIAILFITSINLYSQKLLESEIEVSGNGYILSTLSEKDQLWIDRDYRPENIPVEFKGFDILIHKAVISKRGESSQEATIISKLGGDIYVLARPTNHVKSVMTQEGWNLVPGSVFAYKTAKDKENIAVFTRKMKNNEKLKIPVVKDFGGVIPIARKIVYTATKPLIQVSDVSITVTGKDYKKVKFEEGSRLWTNRDYVAIDIPRDFSGFDFLIADAIPRGEESLDESLRAEKDGEVYVVARMTKHVESVMSKDRWKLVKNSEFKYRTRNGEELMCVFSKNVKKGKKTYIPIVVDFGGVMPLAKNIIYTTVRPAIKVSDVGISVTGKAYKKIKFEEGGKLWINRDYVAIDIPEDFSGFDFLIADATPKGESSLDESLRAEKDGEVYVIARVTKHVESVMSKDNWNLVKNSEFKYRTRNGEELMCIFSKNVKKGRKIYVPIVFDFGGVMPLAKNIKYME